MSSELKLKNKDLEIILGGNHGNELETVDYPFENESPRIGKKIKNSSINLQISKGNILNLFGKTTIKGEYTKLENSFLFSIPIPKFTLPEGAEIWADTMESYFDKWGIQIPNQNFNFDRHVWEKKSEGIWEFSLKNQKIIGNFLLTNSAKLSKENENFEIDNFNVPKISFPKEEIDYSWLFSYGTILDYISKKFNAGISFHKNWDLAVSNNTDIINTKRVDFLNNRISKHFGIYTQVYFENEFLNALRGEFYYKKIEEDIRGRNSFDLHRLNLEEGAFPPKPIILEKEKLQEEMSSQGVNIQLKKEGKIMYTLEYSNSKTSAFIKHDLPNGEKSLEKRSILNSPNERFQINVAYELQNNLLLSASYLTSDGYLMNNISTGKAQKTNAERVLNFGVNYKFPLFRSETEISLSFNNIGKIIEEKLGIKKGIFEEYEPTLGQDVKGSVKIPPHINLGIRTSIK